MTAEEMELEIWRDIVQLNAYTQILRTCMRNRDEVCCAMRHFDLFLLKMYDAFQECLVIGIYRLTDARKGRITFQSWIKRAMNEAKDTIRKEHLQHAHRALQSFLKSEDYTVFKSIRHECWAHRNEKTEPLKLMGQKKWQDLFAVVGHLREIFNSVASAPMAERQIFAPAYRGASYIEDEVLRAMRILEAAVHTDALHQRMTRKKS